MNTLDLNNLSVEHNKILNEISLEIKNDYHLLIEDIYSKIDKNIYWYVNSLLSRNNFVSDVFISLCYLELVKRICNENNILEIIVLNKDQKNVLENYFINDDINIKVGFNIKKQIKKFITPFHMFYLNLSFFFSSVRAKNSKRKYELINKNSEILIIDAFVTPFEIKTGSYKSRHYPKDQLWDFLSPDEKKSVYFVPEIVGTTSNIISVIKILEVAEENFIFKSDFLNISDYFKALFGPLLMKKINFNSFKFRGFMIAPILKTDFYLNITNINSFKGILNFYFFKRVKECNIKIKLIVNWFENQAFDKGFNLGARKFYSATNTIGIQPFVQDLNYQFNLCPIESEELHQLIPKSISVIGKNYKNLINKFYLNLNVSLGPSIRFKYLEKLKNINNLSFKTEFILVALPISFKESCDLLKVIIDLHNNKYLFFKSRTWVLKPHPDLNLNSIVKVFSNVLEIFKIDNRSIDNLIYNSCLVVTNGSSVAIESIVLGKPVCIIGAQNGFTLNPIPSDINSKIWKLCYNQVDLYDFLNKIFLFRDDDYLELIEIGDKIKFDYFEPVNSNSIKKLLQL